MVSVGLFEGADLEAVHLGPSLSPARTQTGESDALDLAKHYFIDGGDPRLP